MEEAVGGQGALLEDFRRVYSSSGERGELIILEGRNLVEAFLGHGGRLRGLMFVGQSHGDLEERMRGETVVVRVGKAEVSELVGFPFHRGVLGLAQRPRAGGVGALAERVLGGGLLVVCPELGDPGNVGAIVRSAAAFGAAGVIVGRRGADVFGRKSMRAAAGSVFSVPIAECEGFADAVERLQAAGIEVVGADGACERSVPIDGYKPPANHGVGLLLGNEGDGLPEDVLARCDRVVRIDISPEVESLNAACAATVLLHAIRPWGRREPGPCSA